MVRGLETLAPGERGRVVGLTGQGRVRHRLADMGVVPGTEIEVVRVAPLGDPLELRLKGYRLSVRRSEAAMIAIEVPERTP